MNKLVCLLLVVFSHGYLIGQHQKDKPNIIFFLFDDIGWQETSVPFYREATALNKRYHTPNMELLARQGVIFTRAYAHAICSPTRVSLMTGLSVGKKTKIPVEYPDEMKL